MNFIYQYLQKHYGKSKPKTVYLYASKGKIKISERPNYISEIQLSCVDVIVFKYSWSFILITLMLISVISECHT